MYFEGQKVKVIQSIYNRLTYIFTGKIISIRENEIIIHSDNTRQEFKSVNYKLNQDKSVFLKNKNKEIKKSKLILVDYNFNIKKDNIFDYNIGSDIDDFEIKKCERVDKNSLI